MKFNPTPSRAKVLVVYETGYGYPEEWQARFDNEGNLSLKDKQGNIITDLSELEGRHIQFLTVVNYHYLISPK